MNIGAECEKTGYCRRQCKYIGIVLVLEYSVRKRNCSSSCQQLKYNHFQKALNRESLCRIS